MHLLMVTQRETLKDERRNNMWLFFLLVICVAYVGVGFLVTYINATSKDDEFKTEWNKILKWPKYVIGR